MLVKNEYYQEVELNSILVGILNDYNKNPNIEVSEIEAKRALAKMYGDSNIIVNQHIFKNKNYAMPEAQLQLQQESVIGKLWDLLKEKICNKFDEETEQQKIAEIAGEAILEIIPGKILLKPLLEIILFYILKFGHKIVCNVKV